MSLRSGHDLAAPAAEQAPASSSGAAAPVTGPNPLLVTGGGLTTTLQVGPVAGPVVQQQQQQQRQLQLQEPGVVQTDQQPQSRQSQSPQPQQTQQARHTQQADAQPSTPSRTQHTPRRLLRNQTQAQPQRTDDAAQTSTRTSTSTTTKTTTRTSTSHATTSSRTTEKATESTATAAPAQAAGGSLILSLAARYQGVPYVYGGSTPRGFDCSGYTRYVFKLAGISLPRTAQQQYDAVRKIRRSEAKPGDLVFFIGRGGVYHTGIYAGGGMMFDAPHTGKTVTKRAIWSSSVAFGRAV
jgi:cell wall-associated NlpC family hydrolase